MADTTLLILGGGDFVGDVDGQIDAGDSPAVLVRKNGRLCMQYGAAAPEQAAITDELPMPTQYAGGTLKAKLHFFTASASSGGIGWEVYVEAKTPDTDTLDLETADSWDSANAATHTLGGTAGDARTETITLTNKDSVAAGDLFRLCVRRDSDLAGDTASGDVFLAAVELLEDQ